ncbi:MAG TPA: hypothetical protein VIU15_06640 [Streptomyces sp.]
MTRSVFRFVPHTIRHAPEAGLTREAFCTESGCEATSGPQDGEATVLDWCLQHTVRNPTHGLFRRVVTDHARVTREE